MKENLHCSFCFEQVAEKTGLEVNCPIHREDLDMEKKEIKHTAIPRALNGEAVETICNIMELAGQSTSGKTFGEMRDFIVRCVNAHAELVEALKLVREKYQEHFDSMPIAWQSVDNVVNEALAKAEGEA